MDESARLRLGVICGDGSFPKWQAEAIEALLGIPGVDVDVLIVVSRISVGGRRLAYDLRDGLSLWRFYKRLYVRRHSKALRPVNSFGGLEATRRITFEIIGDRQTTRGPTPEDVAKLVELDLDALISFIPGLPREVIDDCAPVEIWSFGDEEDRPGEPVIPGFSALYKGDRVVDEVLWRLGNRPGDDAALERAFIPVIPHSLVRTVDIVLSARSSLLTRAVKRALTGVSRVDESGDASPSPSQRQLSNWQTVRLLTRLGRNFVVSQIRGILLADVWNVGVINRPIESLLSDVAASFHVEWMPEGVARGHYLADPFGVSCDDGQKVLVEDFDYRTGTGSIAAIDMVDGRLLSGNVLAVEGHRSYPYLFTHDSLPLLVTESAQAHRVDIYRAISYPTEWEHFSNILTGFPAVDPTIFRYEGRWWLFCTHGDRGPNSELWAWYAKDLSGPWQEHHLNPVKIDIRSSRPAGTPFWSSGHLYRPAQDCSESYGRRISINRLVELSPSVFSEQKVAMVDPVPGRNRHGLHTISSFGDVTLVDGKRRAFVWPATIRELRGRLAHGQVQRSS